MKKSFRIFAITLLAAVMISAIGVAVVRHDNVTYSDIYDVFRKGISLGEPLFQYELPDRTDMSGFPELTDKTYVIYQLNDFNTIETQLEYCTLEVVGGTQKDVLTVSFGCLDDDILDGAVFNTAVKDGTLYIQNECTEKKPLSSDRIKIIISIPDNYKGGYTIKADRSDIAVTNTESTMDMELSLHNCKISAENISASNITAELGNTSAELTGISSHDIISVKASSSEIKLHGVSAQYTKGMFSSTTLNAENISGSFSCESDTSKLILDFGSVSGNINLKANKCTINAFLPKGAPLTLRREERFSTFNNNTAITESEKNNKDTAYILETNVEFTIVTLEEK